MNHLNELMNWFYANSRLPCLECVEVVGNPIFIPGMRGSVYHIDKDCCPNHMLGLFILCLETFGRDLPNEAGMDDAVQEICLADDSLIHTAMMNVIFLKDFQGINVDNFSTERILQKYRCTIYQYLLLFSCLAVLISSI